MVASFGIDARTLGPARDAELIAAFDRARLVLGGYDRERGCVAALALTPA
jgi:hypothetical protein